MKLCQLKTLSEYILIFVFGILTEVMVYLEESVPFSIVTY